MAIAGGWVSPGTDHGTIRGDDHRWRSDRYTALGCVGRSHGGQGKKENDCPRTAFVVAHEKILSFRTTKSIFLSQRLMQILHEGQKPWKISFKRRACKRRSAPRSGGLRPPPPMGSQRGERSACQGPLMGKAIRRSDQLPTIPLQIKGLLPAKEEHSVCSRLLAQLDATSFPCRGDPHSNPASAKGEPTGALRFHPGSLPPRNANSYFSQAETRRIYTPKTSAPSMRSLDHPPGPCRPRWLRMRPPPPFCSPRGRYP